MTASRRVLFLCTHNAARSQMAEALLRHHAAGRFEAYSAGLEPTAVHPLTRQVLVETGIDASVLRAKGLQEFLGRVAVEYAIVVCERMEDVCPRVYPFALRTLHWPFEDPVRAVEAPAINLARFRRVRDQIDEHIRTWLRQFGTLAVAPS